MKTSLPPLARALIFVAALALTAVLVVAVTYDSDNDTDAFGSSVVLKVTAPTTGP